MQRGSDRSHAWCKSMPKEAVRPVVAAGQPLTSFSRTSASQLFGVDAIKLARLDQRSEQCPILGSVIATGKESVLGVELDRPHGALDRIRVHLDPPVFKIERQPVPMSECVAQSLRPSRSFCARSSSLASNHCLQRSARGRACAWRPARRSAADRPRSAFSMA